MSKEIIIQAPQLRGGNISCFHGTETYGPQRFVNISASRQCIELDKNEVSGSFVFEAGTAPEKAIFRIRGMWDIYRDLPPEMANTCRDMATIGVFEVILNDQVIYHGKVTFWNYRRWRFWPAIDIPFPSSALKNGDNQLVIRNHTTPFRKLKPVVPFPEEYLLNTKYHICDVQILFPDNGKIQETAKLPPGTYLGHMVGGHEVTCLEHEDYSHLIELFRRSGQGNLLVFLMFPGKTNHDIDLDLIDTDAIVKAGLYVALRYYGKNDEATIPEQEYIEKLKRFIARLGENFLGFGPHEQHGKMAAVIEANAGNDDVSCFQAEYKKIFAERFNDIRRIKPKALIWDTDPSFYSRFHLQTGTAFPALELCVNTIPLDIASARGTARAYGKSSWGAINSFECQAWGGLGMTEQEARIDPAGYLVRRSRLWRLSQFLLYLGGARTIYSESGMFDHRVTMQLEYNDEHLAELRRHQNDLVKFAAEHQLQGQPLIDIAYLQGRFDVYKGDIFTKPAHKAMGNSLYSWKSLEVCFDITRKVPLDESVEAYQENKLQIAADVRYGGADILPIEASGEILSRYKLLIMTGRHTLNDDDFDKLKNTVINGGNLVILSPYLDSARLKALGLELPPNAPFLIENQLGQGKVFLFNLTDFPADPEVYERINTALHEIIKSIPRDIFMVQGPNVNYYIYRLDETRYRLYVIANNWYHDFNEDTAIFSIFGQTVSVPVYPGQVSWIDFAK